MSGPAPLVPLVSDEDAAPVARQVFDTALAAAGEVPDLYRALANSPDVLKAWTRLAWPLRAIGTTSRATRELMVMRIAQKTGCDYEWRHHLPMAEKAGVTPEQIAELATWRTSERFDAVERAVLGVADAVAEGGEGQDAAYRELATVMDPTSVVDITVTAAWYLAVGRVITALGPFSEHG